MPSVVFVEKNCELNKLNIKNFVEEELYKKCGFKSNNNFSAIHTWMVTAPVDPTTLTAEVATITLYGKTEGRANYENKYEFPPPADKVLFFGSCVLVKRVGEVVVDFTVNEWERIYNSLMGGFEDITEEEEYSEDDVLADVPRTKEGYVKDDFVVDDDEEDGSGADAEESEKPPPRKAAKPAKAPKVAKEPKPPKAPKEPKPPKTTKPTKKASAIAAAVAAGEENTIVAATTATSAPAPTPAPAPLEKKKRYSKKEAVIEPIATEPAASIYDDEPELVEEEYV
jgi:hypothetical protein